MALTLAMIVKNEAAHLRRCLDSVVGLADQIVVVDTGSVDGTREIARSAGAEVVDCGWSGDFSVARNVGLDRVREPWVLVLDADEYLLPESVAGLRNLIAGPAVAAYQLLNKSSQDGGRTGLVGRIVRLFPSHPAVRYEWPVHEQVVTSLERAGIPVLDAGIEIIHTGYSSGEVNAAKQRRNLEILLRHLELARDPHPMMLYLAGGALLDLGGAEQAAEFFRDCRNRLAPSIPLRAAATVRLVACLVQAGRWGEALELMPGEPDPGWHPELLNLRGQTEQALGRADAAGKIFEIVLGCPEAVWLPPCDLASQCAQALQSIAFLLKDAGRAPEAVEVLRLAIAVRTGAQSSAREALGAIRRKFSGNLAC